MIVALTCRAPQYVSGRATTGSSSFSSRALQRSCTLVRACCGIVRARSRTARRHVHARNTDWHIVELPRWPVAVYGPALFLLTLFVWSLLLPQLFNIAFDYTVNERLHTERYEYLRTRPRLSCKLILSRYTSFVAGPPQYDEVELSPAPTPQQPYGFV